MEATRKADIAACRALQRKHGTSYFFATRFLPREHRWAVHALYAFLRVPDEMVDGEAALDKDVAHTRLQAWQDEWRRVRAGEPTTDPVLRLNHRVFTQYHIPDAYAEAFFASMEMDTRLSTYETYEEARHYMYGSAAVVGRMMTHILGYTSELAFAKADALGYAMQWTNFLRDIHEDWQARKRVYLPQDRLRAHGLTNEAMATQAWSADFAALMREEIARADALYAEAETGIQYLSPQGRLGVLVAGRLYQGILRKLEQQRSNPFVGRARTSFGEKVGLAVRAWHDLS